MAFSEDLKEIIINFCFFLIIVVFFAFVESIVGDSLWIITCEGIECLI